MTYQLRTSSRVKHGLKRTVPLSRRNVEIKTRHTKAHSKVPILPTPRSSRSAKIALFSTKYRALFAFISAKLKVSLLFLTTLIRKFMVVVEVNVILTSQQEIS